MTPDSSFPQCTVYKHMVTLTLHSPSTLIGTPAHLCNYLTVQSSDSSTVHKSYSMMWLLLPDGWFQNSRNKWFSTKNRFSRVYMVWWKKKKKALNAHWAAVLQVERPCWSEWSEENGHTDSNWQEASQNSQHIEPWGRWATRAETHIRVYFCQPRTRI